MDLEKKRKLEGTDVGVGGGGASDNASLEQALKRIVSVLPKDQMASILVQAALAHESVAEELYALGNKDTAQRKLFVRGLAWDTTTETLLSVFAEYGEVEEGSVVTDRNTGKSRGFGFITYKSMTSAHRALAEPTKKIDGRMTTCNLAAAGTSGPAIGEGGGRGSTGGGTEDVALRKLYIWGLSFDTANETFLQVFSEFGEIEEGSIAYERDSHKSRGFGFVTYKTAEGARKALLEPSKTIEGRKVAVKYAADGGTKEKVRNFQLSNGQTGIPGSQGSLLLQQPGMASLLSPQATALLQPQHQVTFGSSVIPTLPASYFQPTNTTFGAALPSALSGTGATGSSVLAGIHGIPSLAAYNSALATYAAASGAHAQSMGGISGGVSGMMPTTAGSSLPDAGSAGAGSSAANAAAMAAAAAAQYAAAAQFGLQGAGGGSLGYGLTGFGGSLGSAVLPPGGFFSGQ